MSMNGDLISRSALLAAVEAEAWIADNVKTALRDIAGRLPALDVASVVCCQACKHSRERNEYERGYLAEGVLICTSPDATDDGWLPVWPDHWCKCGERRVDNDKA